MLILSVGNMLTKGRERQDMRSAGGCLATQSFLQPGSKHTLMKSFAHIDLGLKDRSVG